MNRDALIAGHTAGEADEPRSVLDRIAPSWLAGTQVDIAPSERKLYYVRLAVPIVGGLLHLGLVFLYFGLRQRAMALVNVASVLVFLMLALIVRTGRHHVGLAIAVVEAAMHSPVVTLLIGTQAGSLATRHLLGADFDRERRGTLEVKGKGSFETCFVRADRAARRGAA